ncbi:MAG: hypothetical protein EOR00_29730 [Mesorhizobium sp.]|uniref:hypothetical protein n=1 Tax=Mesorhizobium sp. TaxID=1871066 RepID=UPI000FE93A33|nr:hypothetical protein [Mesorhizobium sp.]RWP10974.1 MAG: hypothetical protein EOR00_29730 [Mesorhizobium sp.]
MAAKIWKDLENARSLDISGGEETITENFLLDVQLAHPAEVSTFQFNKREEASQALIGNGGRPMEGNGLAYLSRQRF